MRRIFLKLSSLGLVAVLASVPAQALFHIMVIDEIYPGHARFPDAQYVVLRMTASGQTLVNGHSITTFFPDGTPGPVFGTFTANVLNGASGSRILMATAFGEALFDITADHVTTGRLPFPSGRICFSSEAVDCVAYGDFTGNNGVYGLAAAALEHGLALHRNLDIDDNAAAFGLAPPMPINNAGVVGGADADNDLMPDFRDCAPSDPMTWFAPPEVFGVGAALDGAGAAVVSWASLDELAGPSILYDVVLGSSAALQATGGFIDTVACGGKDLMVTSITDVAPVMSGDSRIYLIRGKNGCAFGTYGRGRGTPDPDPRSLLDDPANDPCF